MFTVHCETAKGNQSFCLVMNIKRRSHWHLKDIRVEWLVGRKLFVTILSPSPPTIVHTALNATYNLQPRTLHLWLCPNFPLFCPILLFRHASVSSTYPCKLVGKLVGIVGWSVGHTFDIQSLVSDGRSNQKVQKTKCIYFRILLLWGPSPPTKMYLKA